MSTMQRNSHLGPKEAPDGMSGISERGFFTVLMVERKLRLRAALNTNFLRSGWDVPTATCIHERLRGVVRQIFDLAICDLHMRDGDVHEGMLAVSEAIPVIVSTDGRRTNTAKFHNTFRDEISCIPPALCYSMEHYYLRQLLEPLIPRIVVYRNE